MAFHLWTISEVYSNADRSVQYIELFTTAPGETLIAGQVISFTPTGSSTPVNYVIPSNLSQITANKSLLIGNAGYAALTGVPDPDFILPDGFLLTTGGTLNVFGVDSITFGPGVLPTDGSNSLNDTNPMQFASNLVAGVNSPRNFADVTGTIQSNVISGTDGPDNLVGTAGDNVISGGGGNDTLTGGAGNDTLDGGAGADTAVYSGERAGYTIPGAASGTVTGPDGTDTLSNIERYQFSDKNLAFDLGLNTAGGNTVRLIGAAFDANNLIPEYVGIGLDLFDGGMSMLEVCQLALGTSLYLSLAGTASNVDFVNTVYENVVGAPPSQGERDFYVGLLQGSGGSMTQADLLVLAANADVNATNINLIGLQQTGVEFV